MNTAVLTPQAAPPERAAAAAVPHLRTAADLPALLRRLGDVPPERVLLDPPPGTATVADAVRLQESIDKRLCEVIDGTLVEKAVSEEASFVAAELIARMLTFARERRLGRVSGPDGRKRMDGGNSRMPDVAFIQAERLVDGRITPGPDGPPPDLAVEVLSPSNTVAEMDRKRREYFASGVTLVWQIDPDTRTASVYTAVDMVVGVPRDGTLDGGTLLPDFAVKLTDLFDVLPAAPAATDA